MIYLLCAAIGYAVRHFGPTVVAAIAVKLKRNPKHGPAQWTI